MFVPSLSWQIFVSWSKLAHENRVFTHLQKTGALVPDLIDRNGNETAVRLSSSTTTCANGDRPCFQRSFLFCPEPVLANDRVLTST